MEAASPAVLETPKRPPFKRRGHILVWLLGVLVVVGIAPLAMVAPKLISISREALMTSHQENQLLLAASIAREVDIQVESVRSQLMRMSQSLGASLGDRPDAQIRRELEETTDEKLPYLRFDYFHRQGVRSISVGDIPEQLEPVFDAGLKEAAEVLAREDHRAGVHPALLSPPILLEGAPPRAVLVASAPVFSNGSFRGVLSSLVDLQTLWHSIASRNRSGHVVFVLDPKGNVFASSDARRVWPGQDVSESPLVQRFLSGRGEARETMPFRLSKQGRHERYVGSYELTTQEWGVFVQARESDVYTPISAMRNSTRAWAVGALVLAALAAVFFARSLSEPINKLAAASRAFAQRDFSARVTVRSHNEVGELAYAFNGMAEDIEAYIQRLKQAAQENRDLFLGTIKALSEAIDAKDPYTRGHSARVNHYSVLLARELGLSEAEIEDIDVSSMLHDVGKIGIDDMILKKPGALNDEEFKIMKTHPARGATIMAPIAQMKSMLPGLRSHHERWSGRGYPDGLAGDGIPLMARIIAVADTFDAITTNRPYQTKMTFERALARLEEIKGEALDARIVDVFVRLCRSGSIRLENDGDPAEALAVAQAS